MTIEEAIFLVKECGLNIEGIKYAECEKVVLNALEKQIPKKTLWGATGNASWRSCPVCHSRENKTHKYCSQCGQALDWSDAE